MRLTNRQKVNGEMAVRQMSEKAQRGYAGTDPLALYEVGQDDETRYVIVDVDGQSKPLTFAEAEASLESWAEEELEEED